MRVANPPGKQKSLVNHGSCYPQLPSPNPARVVKARVFAHEGTATAPGSRCLERDLQTASAWLTVALSSWKRRLSFAVTIGGNTTKRSPWSPKAFAIWATTERHASHGADAGAGRDSKGIGNIAKQSFIDGGAGRGTRRRRSRGGGPRGLGRARAVARGGSHSWTACAAPI